MDSPSLTVFVAHTGKTLELDCTPDTRVSAAQQALATLTGVQVEDQILMCAGAPLDADKPLSAYGLPEYPHGLAWAQGPELAGAEERHRRDVFLYSRAFMRPGAPLPPLESAPDVQLQLPGEAQPGAHPLDHAPSPLLRALPEYERQFGRQLAQGAAYRDAAAQRLAACARLVGELEVQAAAIDAAASNLELHFDHLLRGHAEFAAQYEAHAAAEAEVLGCFQRDMSVLCALPLHPALQREGRRSLGDLADPPRLRAAAAACTRSAQQLAGKVSELEGALHSLRLDVEALLLAAPSVDIGALARQLSESERLAEEQASSVQALAADLAKVRQQVALALDAYRAAAAAAPGGAPASASALHGALAPGGLALPDLVAMLDAMHDTHAEAVLPRMAAADEALAAFAAKCADCKNALTCDVARQLRGIAGAQGGLRALRNRLGLYREALASQSAELSSLLRVRRLPAAYRHCLAEAARRATFVERYALYAGQLAERMGRFREKEAARRAAFLATVERHVPGWVLEGMGLLGVPPHCQVSVAGGEPGLLAVSVEDLQRVQLPYSASQALPGQPAQEPEAAPPAALDAADQDAGVDPTVKLRMEVAELRARVADASAADCLRELERLQLSSSPAAAVSAPAPAASPSGQAGEPGEPPPLLPAAAAAAASTQQAALVAAQQRFREALAARDGVAAQLSAQLAAARAQSYAYEARILELEGQLAAPQAPQAGSPGAGTPRSACGDSLHSVRGSSPLPCPGLDGATGPASGAPTEGSVSRTAGGDRQAGGAPAAGGAASLESTAGQAAVQSSHEPAGEPAAELTASIGPEVEAAAGGDGPAAGADADGSEGPAQVPSLAASS